MDWARASLWGGKALGLALALLCLTRSIEPDGPAAGGVLLILGGGAGAENERAGTAGPLRPARTPWYNKRRIQGKGA